MKYIISEQQNEKMIDLIDKVGSKFVSGPVVKTELFAKHNSEFNYYVIYPTFYVDKDREDEFGLYSQHELADYIEGYLGVPVSAATVKVKWV